jgi:hypothetical protein
VIGQALAAAAARLGDDAPAVLARLGGSIGDDARAAKAELDKMSGSKAKRAEWVAIARAPTTPGLRGVHPTWIEAALAELPERARSAVAAGGGTEIDVWLARWACAKLPPLTPVAAVRWPRSVAQVIALSGDELRVWLERIGADQLAVVMASAGERTAATERIGRPPRAGALGPARASIARCRGVAIDEAGLVRIGARAIAPYFDAFTGRQLIVRLPRPLGLVVAEELAAAASVPIDQCPTWTALAAD